MSREKWANMGDGSETLAASLAASITYPEGAVSQTATDRLTHAMTRISFPTWLLPSDQTSEILTENNRVLANDAAGPLSLGNFVASTVTYILTFLSLLFTNHYCFEMLWETTCYIQGVSRLVTILRHPLSLAYDYKFIRNITHNIQSPMKPSRQYNT